MVSESPRSYGSEDKQHDHDLEGAGQRAGFMAVLSAPSGGGKTTILKKLLASGDARYRYSISATTRRPRKGETHGKDYFFITPEEFHRRVAAHEFIEYALVHGNYYGTPRAAVEEWIAQGKIVLRDIDVQGGINVKQALGSTALLVFIQPPSFECLRERLSFRNTDTPEQIEARMRVAHDEMEMAVHYDRVIVNHNLEETVAEVSKVINEYRVQ